MNKKSWYMYLGVFLFLDASFPILSYFALQSISILWLFFFATLLSLFLTIFIFVYQKSYKDYSQKNIFIPVLFSSLFLGIWSLLYFFGIKYSSPSTAAILLLLQTFFWFIVFNIFWKEEYHSKQIIGSILMLLWGFIVLYEWDNFISLWAWIMLIACISFTISKRWATPIFLLLNRNILMSIIWLLLAYAFVWPIDSSVILENIPWILSIGFLIYFVCRIFWVLALKNLDSFVAISSFPIIPLLVMIFSFVILNQAPTYQEMLWFIPIWIWTLLLISKK